MTKQKTQKFDAAWTTRCDTPQEQIAAAQAFIAWANAELVMIGAVIDRLRAEVHGMRPAPTRVD